LGTLLSRHSFDYHFIRKQKGGRTVIELDQKHPTPEIIDRAQNARLFAKSRQTLVIPDRFEQSATPPNR
jgi:hypothetical protein